MKILLTKTDGLFSRLIMAVTREKASHFAIEFPEYGESGVVCHSNLHGVHIETSATFKKKNIIVESLDVSFGFDAEQRLEFVMKKHEFKMYDYGAILFAGIKILLETLIRKSIKSDIVINANAFTCAEFGATFFDIKYEY